MSKTAQIAPANWKQLVRDLGVWAFTDFERARPALSALEEGLPASAPFELRLAFHRHAAFLYNQWSQYDEAMQHARQAVSILENVVNPLGLIDLWAYMAAIQLNLSNWSAAQECIDRARKLLGDKATDPQRAHVACREGFLNLHLGNLTAALAAFQDAEKRLMSLEEDAPPEQYYWLALVLSGLGDLHERLGDKENYLDAYRRVLPIVEAHQLRPRRAWHYLNAGRAALAADDNEQAAAYFTQALEYAAEGDSEVRTHALGNLGILAVLANKPERALELLEEAAAQYAHPASEADYTNLAKIESWRANLLQKLDDTEGAKKNLESAYEHGAQGHDRQHQAQVCLTLAALHAARADYEKAYHWQRLATDRTGDYYNILLNRERQELEARHQLERSRQEAQMARLRVASLQLRALRAQMNPHFLFNALNAIQGLITSGRGTEAVDYLAKFAKMMRHTLEYSDLEVVSLYQELEFLEKYLDVNRKLRFRDKLQFKLVIDPDIDPDELLVPTMIVQPFVENAIEHGIRPRQEGTLRVEFKLIDDHETLLCIIEDNGIGYNAGRARQMAEPQFQKHRSRGMEITRERLSLLHQLQHRPTENLVRIIDLAERSGGATTGTRVEVRLPVMEEE